MQRVAEFVDHFDRHLRYRAPDGQDRFDAVGRSRLAAAVRPFVAAGRPIALLLPGFAHKNPNPDKVLGALPDLGEHLALTRLHAFCEAASEIYCPPGYDTGCRLSIFADGRVWGDLLGVSREAQLAYNDALRAMIPAGSPHVRWASLDDHRAARDKEATLSALERHRETPAALAALDRALGLDGEPPGEPDRVRVFERFIGLVREDRQWPATATEPEIASACRAAAQRMMLRHAAFTGLLAGAYGDHIRLSVHGGANAGPTFSVRLFERGEGNPLPYHYAVVVDADGGRPTPMRRDVATALPGGVELVTRDGHPWCLRRLTP